MTEYKTPQRAYYEQAIKRLTKRAKEAYLVAEVEQTFESEILQKLLDGKILDQIDFFQAADDACYEWDC